MTCRMTKKDIVELKAMANPPQAVKDVLYATLILVGEDHITASSDYRRAQKLLANLLQRCADVDASKVSRDAALRARDFMKDLTVESMKNISSAIVSVFLWNTQVIETALSQ